MSKNPAKEIGVCGESTAVKYLQAKGYEILARNFHSAQGEIDIVAKRDNSLVFIEVKNYSYRSYGYPLGAVRRHKKQSIIHAARTYLFKNNIKDTNCRFDVIAIYRGANDFVDFQHIQGAFTL